MGTVRALPKKRQLEIYKKLKGFCAYEGISFMDSMKTALDMDQDDVEDPLDYDMVNDYMDEYKIVSYGKER